MVSASIFNVQLREVNKRQSNILKKCIHQQSLASDKTRSDQVSNISDRIY